MIRSGKDYHLFRRFIETEAVAPDLPELDIPDGVAPHVYDEIHQQIKRARALREWAVLPYDRTETMPPLDLWSYEDVHIRPHHGMYVNAAQNILWTIPEGALIYVPHPSFLGSGLFGEVVSPKGRRLRFRGSGRTADFSFQGRRMRNVRRLPMKKLSSRLLEIKKYRVGVTQLSREDTLSLYRQYYGDFEIYGGVTQAEVRTTKDYFSPADATILSALANMVQWNLSVLVEPGGNAGAPRSKIDLERAAFWISAKPGFKYMRRSRHRGKFKSLVAGILAP